MSSSNVEHVLDASERGPLLGKNSRDVVNIRSDRKIISHLLVFVTLLQVGYSFTGVSILYAIHEMTCVEYYKTHSQPIGDLGQCTSREVASASASAVTALGAITTIFAVVNLFYARWTISKYNYRFAIVHQACWPILRLFIQITALKLNGRRGVILMCASQAISGLGGPQGYQLVANSFASGLASPSEETSVFGKLQGCVMLGTAIGYIAGGWSGTHIGTMCPFQIAVVFTCLALCYVYINIPRSIVTDPASNNEPSEKDSSLLGPLKVFLPREVVDENGREHRYRGLLVLGVGISIGVLATGFNPILLQIYATDAFSFGSEQNGYMMAGNSVLRGLFLSFVFPWAIKSGRTWFAHKPAQPLHIESHVPGAADYETRQEALGVFEPPSQPVQPAPGIHFDLVYLIISMLCDTLLTGSIAYLKEGWQIYLIACLLPLAAGSAPVSKGVITEMCDPGQRVDALSAMAILETTGFLITTSYTGWIFAFLAKRGQSRLTFTIEAAVGIVGVSVMAWARFPPRTARAR